MNIPPPPINVLATALHIPQNFHDKVNQLGLKEKRKLLKMIFLKNSMDSIVHAFLYSLYVQSTVNDELTHLKLPGGCSVKKFNVLLCKECTQFKNNYS